MKGIVAFSFALREEEPNPCNVRLSSVVERIIATEIGPVTTVVQWEIGRQLNADGVTVALRVDPPSDRTYLDSETVWESARELFQRLGITEVIPVAQPFLQMYKVRALIKRDGFTVVNRWMGYIGFDPESTQWWTRGPLRLLIYAVAQSLTGLRGHGRRKTAG